MILKWNCPSRNLFYKMHSWIQCFQGTFLSPNNPDFHPISSLVKHFLINSFCEYFFFKYIKKKKKKKIRKKSFSKFSKNFHNQKSESLFLKLNSVSPWFFWFWEWTKFSFENQRKKTLFRFVFCFGWYSLKVDPKYHL